ncbi:protein-disulfide reductase DsbD domain-containing protein [Rhizobium sp. 9140]|uniref:protein-disulfide reductase DsbD domain-containing protein n=1 Tax=Rhizobium sp. 9140 TaxID=1761900 RepID=UPI0015862008|nr:protein-disulfide reductase DsbD domain-containing protein [Rhizobium sp. 9140]
MATAGGVSASETPLAFNDAFKLSVGRGSIGQIHLHWQMPPGYYLYRHIVPA